MMTKLTKSEIQFIKKIFKSNRKCDSFSLYRKLYLSMSDFVKVTNSLKVKGIIEVDGYLVSLTETGINFAININNTSSEKTWRNIPEVMQRSQVPIDHFYIPSIRFLDKKTFKIN